MKTYHQVLRIKPVRDDHGHKRRRLLSFSDHSNKIISMYELNIILRKL